MPDSRRGEQPHAFIADVLGLTTGEFEVAKKSPETLAILGRIALDKIALEKERDMERARAQAYLERAKDAETDEVTGLMNRKVFLRAIRGLRPAETYMAVMMDMRGLKAINDNISHYAGDLVLAGAARTLVQKGVRTGSVLGRWGGDEFAMAIPVDEETDPETIMQRLGGLFDGSETAEVCDIGGGKAIHLSARFGYCAVKEMPAHSIEEALVVADEIAKMAGLQENTRGVMPELIDA